MGRCEGHPEAKAMVLRLPTYSARLLQEAAPFSPGETLSPDPLWGLGVPGLERAQSPSAVHGWGQGWRAGSELGR